MQDAFVFVLVGVLIGAVIAAVWAGLASRNPYGQIGRGGLFEEATPRAGGGGTGAVALAGEREAEIRQMLEARNARRARAGKAPIDVEAELTALLEQRPAADAGLVAEIRDLVVARNARRVRAGKAPLDVEDEVARSLADLQIDP